VITFVTGADTIAVASVQVDAIAVSPREYLDTNLESPGTAGVKFAVTHSFNPGSAGTIGQRFAEITLTPGTPGAASVSPTLSPGTPGALV
jgi:hypothetical protein